MFGKSQFLKQLEANWHRLYRMAYSWSHDPHIAQDVVQETMSRAIKKRKQLKEPEALNAWLFKILANCWVDVCRKNKGITELTEAGELVNSNTPEMDQGRREMVKVVHRAIGKLSMDQRQIVTLVDLEGMSYNEVASILDIPIGTVMSRLCRARNLLRQYLEENGNKEDFTVSNIRRVK